MMFYSDSTNPHHKFSKHNAEKSFFFFFFFCLGGSKHFITVQSSLRRLVVGVVVIGSENLCPGASCLRLVSGAVRGLRGKKKNRRIWEWALNSFGFTKLWNEGDLYCCWLKEAPPRPPACTEQLRSYTIQWPPPPQREINTYGNDFQRGSRSRWNR